MYHMINLFNTINETQTEINGAWVPKRPVCGPFIWRLRDAWKVLTGKADAIMWPGEQ